jgi:4-hydroxyphenylacetate 3-monooxygenase
MRTGKDYINSIRDYRTIYIDGQMISDVTKSPYFSGIIGTISELYNFSSEEKNGMVFNTKWGTKGNKVFMIPENCGEILDRHSAIEKWAKISMGFVGRSPDHVGGFIAGFASNTSIFDKGSRKFSDNVSRFYRKLVDDDLYVSYAIIPPQVDRSKKSHEQYDRFIQVGVVDELQEGIVVRGSQMLATGAAVSDYLFVSCIPPLGEGDEDYALSFVLPISTKGLKLYCRPPYGTNKSSLFDYPMSTRFDESDALVVFDDVFVPWENIFVYRDVKLLQSQFFETPAHAFGNNQAQIRLAVKLRFIAGIAAKVARINGTDRIQGVVEKLGELASLASFVEGMTKASEYTGTTRNEAFWPNPRYLYGPMGLQAEIYPRALGILRELAGAGVLQVPSTFHELENSDSAKDIDRYVRSTNTSSREKIKLFKLAWDIIGSEFAGRNLQYEMFYAGAPYVSRMYAYRNFDYDSAVSMVEEFMKSYDIDSANPSNKLK